eukprot:6852045-Prymnesium_polylepis.1
MAVAVVRVTARQYAPATGKEPTSRHLSAAKYHVEIPPATVACCRCLNHQVSQRQRKAWADTRATASGGTSLRRRNGACRARWWTHQPLGHTRATVRPRAPYWQIRGCGHAAFWAAVEWALRPACVTG